MSKSKLALCDWEGRFVNNFMEYFISKSIDIMDIRVFTEVNNLVNYMGSDQIDVLLIANSLMSDTIIELNVKRLIILSEGEVMKKYSEYPVIYKYQSSEKIICEIMNYYANDVEEEGLLYNDKKALRVIGIYSPVSRSGKTTLALALGQLLSRNKKVLYMNLEEYSGLCGILNDNMKGDLLDLILFQRQRIGNLQFKIKGMVNNLNGMDYISPALFPEELREIKSKEWLELIRYIEGNTDYEVLLLDIGETVSGVVNLLDMCSIIYMPEKQDFFSQGKIKQFEESICNMQKKWIMDKLVRLEVPAIRQVAGPDDYLDFIRGSSFTSQIKKLCTENYGDELGWE